MPKTIRHQSARWFDILKDNKRIILVVFCIIAAGGIILLHRYWMPKITQALIPSWQKTQQMRELQPSTTMPFIQSSQTEPKEQVLPSSTPTITLVSTKSVTPTMTPIPSTLALDTPIGSDVQFIIHRTLPGESLFQYAREYDTDVDTIMAVNYYLPPILYVDSIVVIPIGITDSEGLPTFEAYQVGMRGFTVETITEEFSIDPDSLSKYNNIPPNYTFVPGDWILLPRE